MATPEQIFTDLQQRFKYDEQITKTILDKKITSLQEFRFFCEDEKDVVGTFVTPIQDKLTNSRLDAARLKMAWAAIGAAEKAKETTAAEGITLDEEELLPQSSLATIRETFWKRYHWLPPPEQQPSDKLLSKLTRALHKRSLEVMNVFSVKTLFNQRSNPSTKRVKVAHNLWIGSTGDDEVQPVENWSTYLDQLLVYLIGLAMAGAYALQPPPTTPESLATESFSYVEFPWDLAWKYHFRAGQCVRRYPESVRLSVISSLDLQERAEWAQRFANGSDPLGAVVHKVFLERATHWSQVPLVTSEGGVSARPPEPALPPAPKGPSAGVDQAFAEKLRDGTSLCQAWQKGKCPQQKERGCAQGQHRCARELNSGRVCGDPRTCFTSPGEARGAKQPRSFGRIPKGSCLHV